MLLEIQWFISVLEDNGLVSVKDAVALYEEMGDGVSLIDYAQTILERLCSQMSAEDQQAFADQLQTVLDFAVEQAATGEVPPCFAGEQEEVPPPEPEKPAGISASKLPHSLSKRPPEDTQQPGTSSPEVSSDGFECFKHIGEMNEEQIAQTMKDLLLQVRDLGASDLHISANSRPFIRRNLKLERISDQVLSPEFSEKLNLSILSPEQKQRFQDEMDMNFALELHGDRFRAALMYQKDGVSGSYRLVPKQVRTLAELGFLPKDIPTIERMMDYHNGLILVTGPISSGKTTTLAALVDIANKKREDHIISMEDPIEIVQRSIHCQVTQRQIHDHTDSYSRALRGALRQDPDIIVIGELFDLETIENAIAASETGHLVIGTLHTCDAANTLNRLLDVFPPSQLSQIRAMTAGSLRGVICQRLVPAVDGTLTVGYEILVNTSAVSSVIAEGKTFQLKASMQIGQKAGMCIFDATLLEKYKLGMISYEVAKTYMTDKATLEELEREMAIAQAKKFAAAAAAKNNAGK